MNLLLVSYHSVGPTTDCFRCPKEEKLSATALGLFEVQIKLSANSSDYILQLAVKIEKKKKQNKLVKKTIQNNGVI